MKYVQRRAGRFEFRFPLPIEIAGKPVPQPCPDALAPVVNARTGRFKTELIRALGTADAKTAEQKVLAHIAEAHALTAAARRLHRDGPTSAMSPDQIAALVRAHEVDLLGRDEALREHGLGLDLQRATLTSDGEGMTDDDMNLYRRAIEELSRGVRDQTAKRRPDEYVRLAVNRALEGHGIVLHPDDPAWRQLELGFIDAQRSAFGAVQARLAGESVPTPNLVPPPAAVTITDALKYWHEAGGRGARAPRDGSIAEAERAVHRFVELCGDLPVTDITKAHGRRFRDAMANLPIALPNALRQLPLPKLLNRDFGDRPRRSARTVNKSLALLSGIFARIERDGFFEGVPGWSNPFHVPFEISRTDRAPYEPFSRADLQKLFASPIYREHQRPKGGTGEAAFWFPLISLFTGARRTEIAQLKVRDVRPGQDDIWFFDFTDAGEDQSLKNESSARSVPVHRALIDLGLPAFVAERQRTADGSAPLWPGFEPPLDPKVKAWTKWFGRYLGAHVTTDRAKTFHSFRHTFKRACREAGITEEVHHALTGHSGGGVGRLYGRERRDDGSLDRGISLGRLRSEIDRVSYDVELPRRK